MAETHFFMTDIDSMKFIDWLIMEYQCSFVLDGSLNNIPPELRTLDEVEKIFSQEKYGSRFFVKSPGWTKFEIPFTRNTIADGSLRSFVMQRYGGPAFDLIFGNIFKENKVIIVGSVSAYPYYYLRPNSPEIMDRPVSMKEAFKNIKKYFREKGVKGIRKDTGKETSYMILNNAISLYNDGWTLKQGDWEFIPKEKVPNKSFHRSAKSRVR
jgi:hypothetical protein